MAKQVVQVVLQCSASGVQVVQGGLAGLGNTAQKTQNQLGSLKQLIGGIVTAAAIKQTVMLADSYARMLNRIRVVTSTNQELYAAMGAVERISRETRTSLEANVDMYARVALNVKQLGISQRDVVRFSTSLNHALILSGVTAREAHWGMVQLSQGMASGALRGDELRAVMEQLPVVSDVLSRHLGVTRGELRLLAFQGKVTTTEIIAAFREAETDLLTRFQKRIPTIDESLTALKSSFTAWIGKLDQSVGVTRTVASAIKLLSDNMSTAGSVVGALAAAIGVGLVVSLVKSAAMIAKLMSLTNPWVLAIGAVVAATVLLVSHWDDVLITLAKVADWINNNFGGVLDWMVDKINTVTKAISEWVDQLKNVLDYYSKAQKAAINNAIESNPAFKAARDQKLALEGNLSGTAVAPMGAVPPASVGSASKYEDAIRKWIDARKSANTELSDVVTPVGWHPSQEQQGIITNLQKAMTSYTQSIDIYNQSLDVSKLTEEEHLQLLQQIREGATKNADVLKQAYADGLFTEQEYTRISVQLSQERLKAATDAASGVQRGMNDVFLAMTDFASLTQQSVKDAFSGMEDAIVDFVKTGEFSIKGMVDSVLADLTRLLLRQGMMNLLGTFSGLGKGGSTGSVSGLEDYTSLVSGAGRAAGGDVNAGEPVWVGENGKEIFVPEQKGTVVSHQQSMAAAAPVVNVIQVMSMEEALAAMRSNEGQRIIVNAKGRV